MTDSSVARLHRRVACRRLARPVLIAACAAAAAAPTPAFPQAPADTTPDARIARIVANLRISEQGPYRGDLTSLPQRMHDLGVSAVSVAVLRNGRLAWARAWGTLSRGDSTRADTTTVFQAASISKPVAAAALLRLVAAGRIGLDDDIAPRLTRWRWPASAHDTAAEAVTVRRLLTHTAGLTVGGFPGYPLDGRPIPNTIEVLTGGPTVNTPGVERDTVPTAVPRYSGGGYTVAQALVEELTGGPFAAALDSLVLRPLGMGRSAAAQPLDDARARDAARAHRADGTPYPTRWHAYPELAAAGLWTTPSDLARFLLAVRSAARGERDAALPAAVGRGMTTPWAPPYALGFQATATPADMYVSHTGSNAGYRAVAFVWLGSGDGAVVMTNGDRGGVLAAELLGAIRAEYGWPPAPPAAPMGRAPQAFRR